MPVAWPASVPFATELQGAGFGGPRGAVQRFETDAGPGKRRRVTTAAPRNLPMSIPFLTIAQIEAFEDWFETSIAAGALSFEAVHPHRGTLSTFAFEETDPAYRVSRISDELFTLSFELEELPS